MRLLDDRGEISEANTGIVQICDDQNSWKRVCYGFSRFGWNNNVHAANLVCSQLGYEDQGMYKWKKILNYSIVYSNIGATSVGIAIFLGPTSETDIRCMGNESTVADCPLLAQNCRWYARVTCRKGEVQQLLQ